MPTLDVETAEGIRIRTELAGVGSRLAAALLDLILIVAGYLSLLLVLLLLNYLMQDSGLGVFAGISGFIVGLAAGGMLLVLPAYFIVFHTAWNGQTPGKRMLGIRVVDAHGSGADSMAHILRGMLWPIDALVIIPVPIGLMMIALTPRCRRLGDLAAGTLVLSESSAATYAEPWPDQSWEGLESKVLELSAGMAAKLSEEDVGLMRDAICRRDVPRTRRNRIYRQIVEHYGQKLGFTPNENERVSLKELYLFGRGSREP